MKPSPELLRCKKLFVGDLRSFMARHGLSPAETSRLLGLKNASNVSQWLAGRSTPTYKTGAKHKGTDHFRKIMREYDEAHPVQPKPQPEEPQPQQVSMGFDAPEDKQQIRVLIIGEGISIDRTVPLSRLGNFTPHLS